MKKIKQIGLMFALFCVLFFIQCSSDENKETVQKPVENYSEEINLLREFLSTSRHYNIKKIVYDSERTVFIIDGDMLISLEDVRSDYNEFNGKSTSKSKQRVASYIVSPEIAKAIKIYVYPDVPTDWQIAITEAVKNWNAINSNISITIVTTLATANIKITAANKGRNGTIAEAFSSTSTGRPGSNIYINSAYNTLEAPNKIFTIVHELGHTFGLNHTNELDGSVISCTPVSDPSSVMNAINNAWRGFSYYDNVAISTLYPVEVGTKKIYRYKKNEYYFYSINPCEIIPGKDGYVFDGDVGYLYTTQVAGTVPLYRSINVLSVNDHRLSTTRLSVNDIILGYLYPTQQLGTTKLYGYKLSNRNPPFNNYYLYTKIVDSEYPSSLTLSLGYVYNNPVYATSPKGPIVF